MPITAIKAEKVVDVGLQLLEREVLLPSLVWRDAAGDFRGAKDDTISIRLPSYAKARKNTLRSGAARTRDSLVERKVDVSLTSRLYHDVVVTDENLTLDIVDFTRQVLGPQLRAIARAYEDEAALLMTEAAYAVTVDFDETKPYESIVDARKALNDAQVPQAGRSLVVGSSLEAAILKSPQFAQAQQAGDNSALRDAKTGRIAGFEVYVCNSIPPDEGYAFHKTAYILNTRAPMVPDGAPWGATGSQNGFAIRTVQVLDPDSIEDIVATEAWVGKNIVTDNGAFDGNGKFEPDVENNATNLFVRSVKLAVAS